MTAPVRLDPSDEPPVQLRTRMRLLLGIDDGQLSGINTYIQHVAAAAATTASDVTLLVAEDQRAAALSVRFADAGVHVISLGMPPPTPWQERAIRLSPSYAARRLEAVVAAAREGVDGGYDVAHLNHPFLAVAVRPLARRVSVAAWFYPHSATRRAISIWQHSGRRPKSAALAVKGMLHYGNDVRGFKAADVVIAPTGTLADDLRRSGINAVHSTPPAAVRPALGERSARASNDAPTRLLICAGDLGHPRKNVGLAIDALQLLSRRGGAWELELIGRNAAALRRRLERLPPSVSVIVRGPLPSIDVHQRMRVADVVLVPSLFEEWGFVAVEAVLHGTPVVTLPVYPFAEMLGSPLGFTATDPSAAAYAEAIDAALASPAGADVVVGLAANRFGLESAGRRLTRIWEECRPPSDEPW